MRRIAAVLVRCSYSFLHFLNWILSLLDARGSTVRVFQVVQLTGPDSLLLFLVT